MTDHGKPRQHARRTEPSGAAGASGARAARQPADDAVLRRPGTAEDSADAGGHRAKHQRPGIGREEQIRPADELQADVEDRGRQRDQRARASSRRRAS
ncbi:hypothetical protein ACFWWM_42565 [Streptomyces sp. NPDC058682]|uniref:hypothetical protein n=1 Tax=Streptomyces sp. NPDC058682 TaxID=3346596 RepID=UPI00364F0BA3